LCLKLLLHQKHKGDLSTLGKRGHLYFALTAEIYAGSWRAIVFWRSLVYLCGQLGYLKRNYIGGLKATKTKPAYLFRFLVRLFIGNRG
jgi:hypothetical protein